jgi:hypothetical protein
VNYSEMLTVAIKTAYLLYCTEFVYMAWNKKSLLSQALGIS